MHFQKPREIAARVLLQREAKRSDGEATHRDSSDSRLAPPRARAHHLDSAFIEELFDDALADARIAPADRRLAQEITYGAVRWQATLDWLIARKTAGKNQKAGLRVLLRTALYQIFWLSRIPDHAAVNETVELARQMGFGPQSGFVNAVLRGYLREREATIRALEELKNADPALGYSHPKWLCDRWQKRLGDENTRKLLEWNNTPPPAFGRVNLLKTNPEQLREQWAREQVEAKLVAVDWARDAFIYELRSHPPLRALPSFTSGLFYVQDPSTLLAVAELDPQPGETILDLCAAPGGKTCFIAERIKNIGRVIAHDISEERLRLIKQNATRLGATSVEAVMAIPTKDGTQRVEAATTDEPMQRCNDSTIQQGPFDRILVDAPCSNTGVIRRRVDLRWRIRPEEITRLRATQLDLLHRATALLKHGGTLVYSTCSIEPEENTAVTADYLKAHPEMHLQRERLLTPWENGVDGAYVARLVKGLSA